MGGWRGLGRLAALAWCSLAFIQCATTPEPELTAPPPAAGGGQAEALAEAQRQAQAAVARAVEAGAETYDPVVLREARDALQEGERLRVADPEGAAEALGRAASKAEAAYRNSLGAARQQRLLTMDLLLQELRDQQADRFMPEEYAAAAAEAAEVEELFAAGSLTEGNAAAGAAVRRLRELRDSVAARLARVLQLKAATEALQDQLAGAAQADAAQAAAMNDRYAQGREALEERYALADAERHFAAAAEAGRAALAAPVAPVAESDSGEQVYTVRLIPERRESLWSIAEHEYGDPLLWRKIWERNRELIQDPDLILPGWRLYLPPAD